MCLCLTVSYTCASTAIDLMVLEIFTFSAHFTSDKNLKQKKTIFFGEKQIREERRREIPIGSRNRLFNTRKAHQPTSRFSAVVGSTFKKFHRNGEKNISSSFRLWLITNICYLFVCFFRVCCIVENEVAGVVLGAVVVEGFCFY